MKIKLLGKNLDELKKLVVDEGLPGFTARQIAQWLYVKKVRSIDEMTNLSKAARARLSEKYEVGVTSYSGLQISSDGTKKYLFPVRCTHKRGLNLHVSESELEDSAIEAVMIPDDDRATLCVSSQAGCRMGCKFCMTGRQGFHGHMSAADIISQFIAVDESDRLTNAVFMGMGEPLDNYDNAMRFLSLAGDENGLNLGMRNISLSTCGIVPKMYELMEKNLQITLSVSLHAPENELRSKIMPVNRKYPIDELMKVCREYTKKTSRRISFEYAMIAGINDTSECAKKLASLVKGMLCHVNLIPANEIDESSHKRSGEKALKSFCDILSSQGINVTVRRSLGSDIEASCGQLRSRHEKN